MLLKDRHMTGRRRPPAQDAMLGLITSYQVSQLVFVVARLGVADALARGPLSVPAIARRVGAESSSLQRVLRALASLGVFAESPDGRFRLTPLAQTLRSDRSDSVRSVALMALDDYNWNAWGALEHGVRTARSPFQKVHGQPMFPYLQQNPDKERVFCAAMASLSATENAAIARAYPFGRHHRLVDLGGAHGHLLATVLRRHASLVGVLFDQPQVVAAAPQAGFITAAAVGERCTAVGGDFFVSVPEGADVYVMKYILHGWNDESCLKILINCRAAMAAEGRLLVVDHIIPRGNSRNSGKLLDINMMVISGGRERTRAEFQELLSRARLRLVRVIRTDCPLSILEAAQA